jgi:hypothetical protein
MDARHDIIKDDRELMKTYFRERRSNILGGINEIFY